MKNIIKAQICEDLDGTAVIQRACLLNNPIIQVADISTRTGKDIQQGVMKLLTGAIRYIRKRLMRIYISISMILYENYI